MGHLRFEIFVRALDGSEPVQLTDFGGRAAFPDWSPDGTLIVFSFAATGEDRNIYVMDAKGANVQQLTDHPAQDERPRWAPLSAP